MCVLSHVVYKRAAQVFVWNNISTVNCYAVVKGL